MYVNVGFNWTHNLLFEFLQKLARSGARCDFGVFVGASRDNYTSLPAIGNMAAALKMYLNETFTTLKLDDISIWMKVKLNFFNVLDSVCFKNRHLSLAEFFR